MRDLLLRAVKDSWKELANKWRDHNLGILSFDLQNLNELVHTFGQKWNF